MSRRRCPRRRHGTGRSPGRRAPRRRSRRGSGATPDGSSRSRPRSGSRSGGTGCAASATEPGRRRSRRGAVAAEPAPRSSNLLVPRPHDTVPAAGTRVVDSIDHFEEPAPSDCRPSTIGRTAMRRPTSMSSTNGRSREAVRMSTTSTQPVPRASLPAWPATLPGRSSAGTPRMPRGGRRPSCSTSRASRGSCARPASRRSMRSRPARSPTRAGSGARPRTTSGSPGSGGRARCSTRVVGRPGRAGGAAARSTMRVRPPNPGRRATRAARRSSGRARMARSAG